jgi:MFS family permease
MLAIMAWAMARGASAAALIALHVTGGFCGSFFDSAVRAYLASVFPAKERLDVFGRLRVAINIGWAAGPALGGLMAARSYPMLFAFSSASCLVCLGLLRALVPPLRSLRPDSAFAWSRTLSAAGDGRFLRLSLLTMLIAAVMSQLVVSLSVHSVRYLHLTEAQVGLLFTLNGVIVVLVQSPFARRLTGLRLSAVLAAGSLLYALGYGSVGFAAGFVAMATAVSVLTLGEVVVSPGLHTLAANLAPEKLKGRYLGFQGLAHQLGVACGPLLGGLGLDYLSPRWSAAPWLLVAVTASCAGLGFSYLGRRLSPVEDGTNGEVPPETRLAEVPV